MQLNLPLVMCWAEAQAWLGISEAQAIGSSLGLYLYLLKYCPIIDVFRLAVPIFPIAVQAFS
jgi:hypothetical protein